MQYIQTINCSFGKVRQRPDKILEVKLFTNIEISESGAEEFIMILDYFDTQYNLLLIDHRTPHSFSFDGLMKIRSATNIKAIALLTKEGINTDIAVFISSLIANFKVEVFCTKKDCIHWLKSFEFQKISTPQNKIRVAVK